MDILRLMKERHSVRQYLDTPIPKKIVDLLLSRIAKVEQESGLQFRLVLNEPDAFSNFLARYGKFKNVRNYIAILGPKGKEESAGYYGQDLVLYAQSLGLNTCWVGGTYSKKKTGLLQSPDKLYCVIAIGYGQSQGVPHRTKTFDEVVMGHGPFPDWFHQGIEAALLAPTALNQQKFKFGLEDGKVKAVCLRGPYARLDLGIVKYQFEKGAGRPIEWI